MADRCPRCRFRLDDSKSLACPNCGYSLRWPAVGKVGVLLTIVGFLALLAPIFIEDLWIEAVAGGIGAIAIGLAAVLAASWMIGRARGA